MAEEYTPFDHFNRINSNYKQPTEEQMETWQGYLADTYYSHYIDTVAFAEMSSCLNVPEHVREILYRALVQKEKRPHFWPKAEKEERILNIMKRFDMSRDKAAEVSELMGNARYLEIFKEPEKVKVEKTK